MKVSTYHTSIKPWSCAYLRVHARIVITHPLHVVVVGLLQLDALENCLVLVGHSQQVHLPPGAIQTAIKT